MSQLAPRLHCAKVAIVKTLDRVVLSQNTKWHYRKFGAYNCTITVKANVSYE